MSQVAGRGFGVVLGITDARPDATEEERNKSTVWGVSLTHGSLYIKHGTHKANLGMKTLVPPIPDETEHDFDPMVLEVEVRSAGSTVAWAHITAFGCDAPGNAPSALLTIRGATHVSGGG